MNLKQLKPFALSLLQNAALPLFGLGSFYILVRDLNSDEVGQWALFIAISAFVEGTRDGLMNNAMIHYLNAVDESEHVRIKSSSLVINLLVTLFFSIAIFLLGPWLGDVLDSSRLSSMLRLYSINLLTLVFFSHFVFIQRAKVAYMGILLSSICRYGVFFISIFGIIVLAQYELDLVQLVLLQLIGIALGTFVGYLFCKKFLVLKFEMTKQWMSKLWKYGRYGMFTNISVSIITSTDHLMLGGMISTSSVAVYNVAVKITNFFNLPSVALSGILLPEGIKTAVNKENDKLKRLYETAVASTLVGLIPSVLFALIFPNWIITIIAGEDYLGASEILTTIIFTTLMMPYFQNYGMIVNAIGKPKLDFIFVSLISLVNIIANYFLIKLFGMKGAAYASLMTHIIGLIFILIVLKRIISVNLLDVFKRLIELYMKLFKTAVQKVLK